MCFSKLSWILFSFLFSVEFDDSVHHPESLKCVLHVHSLRNKLLGLNLAKILFVVPTKRIYQFSRFIEKEPISDKSEPYLWFTMWRRSVWSYVYGILWYTVVCGFRKATIICPTALVYIFPQETRNNDKFKINVLRFKSCVHYSSRNSTCKVVIQSYKIFWNDNLSRFIIMKISYELITNERKDPNEYKFHLRYCFSWWRKNF